ncbi:hypothetical protein ITJ86_00090 [Winogradskyella sp. F6397]|uniref:DUF1737 domain-containing protein n=1 Tax=Winogradskyella marina TaxID=2785530 RepID=A0ABS0ECW9_9FLAO|nr:hypothetical protein [Winogradskyella marina]MBF8148273.1 hypothetical protein [Winogradskyella marina]
MKTDELILEAETQTALEHEIIKHNAKGYKPIGNVINIDGIYQIKMAYHGI